MSKQQNYQQLSTEVPNGEDHEFATRLPQAGVACPTHGAYHGNFAANCTCGAARGAPMAYPAATYAGAHLAGYPTGMPMTAPVGWVVQDPLAIGKCGKKRARRMACAANGCHGCRNCRGRHGCRRRRGGPVHLLFGLARAAFHSAQDHKRSQPPAPAHKSASSSQ